MTRRKEETPPLQDLKTIWFEGSRLDEKDTVKADLARARDGFRHLARILKARRPSVKFTNYDTPAWQYKLAHINGQLEEIEYILNIIDPIVRYDLNDR